MPHGGRASAHAVRRTAPKWRTRLRFGAFPRSRAIMREWLARPFHLPPAGTTRRRDCAMTSERRSAFRRPQPEKRRPRLCENGWRRTSSPRAPVPARRWTRWRSSTAGGARTERSSPAIPRRGHAWRGFARAVDVVRKLLPGLDGLSDRELHELDDATRVIDAETRALREAVAREATGMEGPA